VAEQQASIMTRTPSAGGVTTPFADTEDVAAWITDLLPQGTHVFSTTRSTSSISADHGSVNVLDAGSLDKSVLLDSGYGARYVPTGHLVFGRGGDLYAASFDAKTLTISGLATRVIDNVAMQSLVSGHLQIAFSTNGLLAYVGGGDTSIGTFQWLDRQGNFETIPIEPGAYNYFDLSPDDRRLAVQVADVRSYVWIYDFDTGTGRKLPVGAPVGIPSWSPDGDQVLLLSRFDGVFGVSVVDGDAGFTPLGTGFPSFWSSTGSILHSKRAGIFSLSDSSGELEMVVDDEGAGVAEASPDGRWIAYTSTVTGRLEVRIGSLPKGAVNRQVSTDGGIEPVWCRGCDELFYRNGNRWYTSKIGLEPELSIGAPQLVFEVPGFVDTVGRSYDISRDGQRLLVLRSVNEPTRTKLHLVHNWFAELERLVPRETGAN
jgi:serine/threonine-protein kinase